MKRSDVAAELRKAAAGTPEEQRTALARIKLARARVNAAASGRITGATPAAPVASTLRLFSISVEGDDRAIQAAAKGIRRLFTTPTDRRPRR